MKPVHIVLWHSPIKRNFYVQGKAPASPCKKTRPHSIVHKATWKEPKILGKPETFMFEAVTKDFPDVKPERTIMIGDK